MKIMRNKIFVIMVVMAMIFSVGTSSFAEELIIEEPVVEEPVVEEPVVEEPVVEEPVVEEPVVEEPVVEEPVVEEPVVKEPVVEEPVVEEPVVEEPVVEEPVVEEPVVEEPVVEEPVVEEPVVEEPVVEEPVVEEPVVEEPVVEEPVVEEPVVEEPVVEEPVVEEPVVEEPVVEEPAVEEPVFIEEIIPRYISIDLSVEPERESYTNGDLIQYEIRIENNGTDPIEDLDISDDMGVSENIGYLDCGERALVKGSYEIDDYNRMETIGNTVGITATCDGEKVSGEVGFEVDIEIPQGSISITNSVLGAAEVNKEFTVLVEGPDNYINYVELADSDTVTLRNLFMGDYRATPLGCMNFSSSCSDGSISITRSSLNLDVSVEYSLDTNGWFSDSDSQTIKVMDVDSEDIDFSRMELQSSDLDIRSDEIYLDLEPLIVLVEVQVEALQQPEGEESSSEADPVKEVTSEPVEAGLQEEVTEPDAAEETGELEPMLTEETEEQGSTEETNIVVPEESSDQAEMDEAMEVEEEVEPVNEQEEDSSQVEIGEPEAVIPENPFEEAPDEVDEASGTEEIPVDSE